MRRILTLLAVPAMLLAMFCPFGIASASANGELPPDDFFQFPFPLGETWTFNGVHDPHRNAIDFSVGKPWPRWRSNTSGMWVVAAAPGILRRTSRCGFEIDHADGWTTVYYHVENIQRDGGEVQANERLANIANTPRDALCEGGSASAPHLHFELKHNGVSVPLDGLVLSGWRIHSGRGGYDSNCERMYLHRGADKRCAYAGAITNEGVALSQAGQPTSNQGGAVDSSDGGTQNSVAVDVDSPAAGALVASSVEVRGWALNRAATEGTGVDHIHLYLDGPAGEGTFVAEAAYGAKRPDLVSVFGAERFKAAGFTYSWKLDAVPPGEHTLFIYTHPVGGEWTFVTRSIEVAAS